MPTIPVLNETSFSQIKKQTYIINNKIEPKNTDTSGITIVSNTLERERRKNRDNLTIVVAVAGIFHRCIGGEIFPLLSRTVRRTHAWWSHAEHTISDPFPPFSPILSLIFVVYASRRISQEARVRSTAVNSKI